MIGTTISHYKLLEKLGEGGMGVVYKAVDEKLDRPVAMKFLSGQLSSDPKAKARFLQEAKVVAALHHPNILAVYEIDEEAGSLFIVMEFVEGRTLKQRIAALETGTGIPAQQAVEWISQVARGLKTAHEQGIIHRDIKSENVLVDENGQLKIMDFGIAKLRSSSGLTRTGTSLGTLSYISPEQAQGGSADERSDIWSLGVVLYEMLTADLPFKAEHEAGLLYLIMNEEPPRPSLMDRKIPHEMDAVIRTMLAKDRSQRYQTMDDLLAGLRHAKTAMENAPARAQSKAIAVLPFGNISPDKESDYFSDGLTEELIINLSRLKDIRVIPRTTSMQYRGTTKEVNAIGRELGTRYILAGSVRKFQDNLRIAVELVDVEADAQLWAETYKGKLEDVFDIQEKVSKQIVDALMVKLTPKEEIGLSKRATTNPQAFDCNLRARESLYRHTKHGIQTAIQLFQKAIDYDARYAEAYAGLSESFANYYQRIERDEKWLDKAMDAGLRALMYDSTLSEAYSALGLVYLHRKSHAEALESSQKAIELNPDNSNAYWILGRTYHTMDNDRNAIAHFEKAIAINPDFYFAYMDLWAALERLHEQEKYRDTLQSALKMYPRYLALHPDDARAHIHFAIALARSDRREEAMNQAAIAIELSPNDPVIFYNAACFYSMIGDAERAIDALRNAIDAGYEYYEWIKRDPDLDSIRGNPEFVSLMKGK